MEYTQYKLYTRGFCDDTIKGHNLTKLSNLQEVYEYIIQMLIVTLIIWFCKET